MHSTRSTHSFELWNLHGSDTHHQSHPHHFPGILPVKQGRVSANHGLFLLNTNNGKRIKGTKKMRFNAANEIHQLASSGFGPPQGSNWIWDAFFTILLPFVQGIFCWGPSQLLKQLGGLNPVDKAVDTAEMGTEIVKDVANKVGGTAVESVDLGTEVVKNVAGKVKDTTAKSVELETEVVENVVENAEGVADGIAEKLPVDKKLKDTVKGVEDVTHGAVEDIKKIFGRGRGY